MRRLFLLLLFLLAGRTLSATSAYRPYSEAHAPELMAATASRQAHLCALYRQQAEAQERQHLQAPRQWAQQAEDKTTALALPHSSHSHQDLLAHRIARQPGDPGLAAKAFTDPQAGLRSGWPRHWPIRPPPDQSPV